MEKNEVENVLGDERLTLTFQKPGMGFGGGAWSHLWSRHFLSFSRDQKYRFVAPPESRQNPSTLLWAKQLILHTQALM